MGVSDLDGGAEVLAEEGRLVLHWAGELPAWWHASLFDIAVWQYAALMALVLAGLIARGVIKYAVGRRLRRFAERLGKRRAYLAIESASAPLATLAMAALLSLAIHLLQLNPGPIEVARVALRVLMALAVVSVGLRLADFASSRLADRAMQTESKLDDQLVPLVRKTLKTLVVLGGILFILQNLHVNIGSLLAGLGIGGLAFAFAAKETLSNVFGSVMIFVDRPFHIGDWIVVNGAEGIVEEVGFRSTRIRTFYNSVVAMPNHVFNEAKVDNYGRREFRRTFTTLNLVYGTTAEQLQAFCEGVRAVIVANPYTRKDYYEVHFCGFGAHSLDVMLYFFFKVDSWSAELRERHNVYMEILRLAQELQIEFAFPTQTLNIERVATPMPPSEPMPPKGPADLAGVIRAFGPGGTQARPGGAEIVHGAFSAGSAPSGDSQA